MNREMQTPRYVWFDNSLCTGCGSCLKGCPTKAIRIRNSISIRIEGQCIGCGECIRVCPTGAVSAVTCDLGALQKNQISIALVSSVLHAQFPGVMPKDVLLGLRKIGFQHTVGMSYFVEMFQYAAETYVKRNRIRQQAPWPLISPVCPVVVRLIAVRFPRLLPHIIPVMRPVALMAREVKRRVVPEYRKRGKSVSLYYINPCPTMMGNMGAAATLSPSKPAPSKPEFIERAMGINDVYGELLNQIDQIIGADRISFYQPRFEYEICATGNGPMWTMSGGEIGDMNIDKSLAVAGIKETITYLEKIELGLFHDMEYMEFRTCSEACLGGALTAIDKYLARSVVQKMVKRLGLGKRLSPDHLLRLYEKKWFHPATSSAQLADVFRDKKAPLSIETLKKIDMLLDHIQGRDCTACGAPDCKTFAEDVVKKKTVLRECVLLRLKGKTDLEGL